VPDTSSIASALAPGVGLTSAVIYWANLQSRLDTLSGRVRRLNAELRTLQAGSPRAESLERQVALMTRRSRVLHLGVVLSVVALLGFLGSSAVLFFSVDRPIDAGRPVAIVLFTLALGSFGASVLSTLWEMLWAYRSLEEDVSSSRPAPRS
jgi:hypothetical protein